MIFDSALIDQKTTQEMTPEGYLLAKIALTKVGVQDYELSDLTGSPADIGKLVGVFRPPETVFHQETKDSAKMKPFTELHPGEFVDIDNFKNLAVGHIGDTISPLDTERLGAGLLVTDKNVIAKIKDGLKEISVGYTANIVQKKGIYKGQKYDYAFEGPMYINHIALVPAGRCGDTVSILDNKRRKLMSDANNEQNTTAQNDGVGSKSQQSVSDLMDTVKGLSDTVKDLQKQMGTMQKSNDDFQKKLSAKQEDAATFIEDARRAKIIDKVKSLVKEVGDKPVRDLLVEACDGMVENVQDKSDDYLMALVDQKLKSREAAKSQFNTLADSKPENQVEDRIYGASDLINLSRQENK